MDRKLPGAEFWHNFLQWKLGHDLSQIFKRQISACFTWTRKIKAKKTHTEKTASCRVWQNLVCVAPSSPCHLHSSNALLSPPHPANLLYSVLCSLAQSLTGVAAFQDSPVVWQEFPHPRLWDTPSSTDRIMGCHIFSTFPYNLLSSGSSALPWRITRPPPHSSKLIHFSFHGAWHRSAMVESAKLKIVTHTVWSRQETNWDIQWWRDG